jgi:hypothetical protein
MLLITTREFRANQKKYFDLAERETVLIARKNGKTISMSVANDDDVLSKEDIMSIRRGLEDVRHGRTVDIENIENVWASIL